LCHLKLLKGLKQVLRVVGVKRVVLLLAIKVDENGQGYISEEVKQ
jgi:hypothetical protein